MHFEDNTSSAAMNSQMHTRERERRYISALAQTYINFFPEGGINLESLLWTTKTEQTAV